MIILGGIITALLVNTGTLYAIDYATMRATQDCGHWKVRSAVRKPRVCRYLGLHLVAGQLKPTILWMDGDKESGTRAAMLVDAAWAKLNRSSAGGLN